MPLYPFQGGRFAQDIHVYIAFPCIIFLKEIFLTEEQHALWINGVVLPSQRSILPPASMQYFPAAWAIGAGIMRANHNEHRTWDVPGANPIRYAVQEAHLSAL